jgi:hypothetical protein
MRPLTPVALSPVPEARQNFWPGWRYEWWYLRQFWRSIPNSRRHGGGWT